MNEPLTLALAWLAGLVLGGAFFGALWWTVSRGLGSRQPALWFMGSLLLRLAIAAAGFYFVAGGDWKRLLPCLLGFVMARLAATRAWRAPADPLPEPPQEARHAP